MNIIKRPIVNNRYYNRPEYTKNHIIIHSTGDAEPSAERHYRYFNSPDCRASVHYFVDGRNGEIIQTLEDKKWAAHAGVPYYNQHAISVEMCEPSSVHYYAGAVIDKFDRADVTLWHKTVINSVIPLCAYLCQRYKIKPVNILGHYELRALPGGEKVTHTDPAHIWEQCGLDYSMHDLQKGVEMYMTHIEVFDTIEEVPTAYRYTIAKLMDKGWLQGNNGKLGLTREMCRVLTINDRAGCYGD